MGAVKNLWWLHILETHAGVKIRFSRTVISYAIMLKKKNNPGDKTKYDSYEWMNANIEK